MRKHKKNIAKELKDIRRLVHNGVKNERWYEYSQYIKLLSPISQAIMQICYIEGRSYEYASYKLSYSVRQIERIVADAKKQLNDIINGR